MSKNLHELRDPIHVFIRLSSEERKVLDSRPFQRLRYVHQLALTYLVYPGATHRRFEHSLGVMELASRIFDVVTQAGNLTDEIRQLLPELSDTEKLSYWRRVLRMAALCHDIGHLPFSHAAEHELLPAGWDHERLTLDLLESQEMQSIFLGMTPPVRAKDVAKLAVGPKKLKSERFSSWEAILSEIITGDAFGADRMDYLLRDSHHAGVAYGKFDHYRLIDTLRILRTPPHGDEGYPEPALGVEEGGLQSTEALLLARYFMYSQLYLHHVRRIYDIHLKDFLRQWLPGGQFSTATEDLLEITDNEVTAAMLKAARDPEIPGHDAARRIVCRDHFRVLYQWHPADAKVNPEAGKAVFEAARERFGGESVRHDPYSSRGGTPDFPVQMRDGTVVSSVTASSTLAKLPLLSMDYVFIEKEKLAEAREWLRTNKDEIIRPMEETE
jgi:HD superfamily phosphohydrolase